MVQQEQSKRKAVKSYESAKPAPLLFGKDVLAQDIVDAIKAESKCQLETGRIGRRMVMIKRHD
jgi:hypothetical protein